MRSQPGEMTAGLSTDWALGYPLRAHLIGGRRGTGKSRAHPCPCSCRTCRGLAGRTAGQCGSVPVLTATGIFTQWQFAPAVSVLLALCALGYLAGARRVRRQHPQRPWPVIRTGAFVAGLAMIAVATESSAARYDDVLVSAHMVQHVLLIMVAPPLLVAGRPVTLALHAAGNPAHRWLIRILRSRAIRVVTRPVVVTIGYAAAVIVTHTPPAMALILASPVAHDAEHVIYLVAGYLYFLPIIGSEPLPWRVSPIGRFLMLLAGMQVDSAVGITLVIQGHEIFPGYARPRAWGPSPLADLHLAGLIMWLGSDIVMTAVALVIAVTLVRERQRRAARQPVLASSPSAFPADPDIARLAAHNAYVAQLTHTERASAPDGRWR